MRSWREGCRGWVGWRRSCIVECPAFSFRGSRSLGLVRWEFGVLGVVKLSVVSHGEVSTRRCLHAARSPWRAPCVTRAPLFEDRKTDHSHLSLLVITPPVPLSSTMLKPRTPVAYLSLSLLFSFSVLAFFLHRAHPEILHRVPEVLRQQGLLGSTKAPKTPPGEAWAFATFLAGPTRTEQEEGEAGEDGYFVSTRVLIYQLLHSETARVNHASGNGAPIPFLVLVTEAVSQRKRKRLEKDGAVVVPVPPLEGEIVEGMAVTNPRYKDNLIKLRLAEMGDYDKVRRCSSTFHLTARDETAEPTGLTEVRKTDLFHRRRPPRHRTPLRHLPRPRDFTPANPLQPLPPQVRRSAPPRNVHLRRPPRHLRLRAPHTPPGTRTHLPKRRLLCPRPLRNPLRLLHQPNPHPRPLRPQFHGAEPAQLRS